MGTNTDLDLLIGTGSYACDNKYNGINVERVGALKKAAIIFDLKYNANIENFLLLSDKRYRELRVIVTDTPLT